MLATLGAEKRLSSCSLALVDQLRGWPEALKGVPLLEKRQESSWKERTLGAREMGRSFTRCIL